MSSPVRTVEPDAPVQRAANGMLEHGTSSVIVTDEEGGLAGIITTTDFVAIAAEGGAASEACVADYMSTDIVTATVNDPIRDVADTMIEGDVHHVPIVDETEGVVGIVTTTDLTAYLSRVQTPSPS